MINRPGDPSRSPGQIRELNECALPYVSCKEGGTGSRRPDPLFHNNFRPSVPVIDAEDVADRIDARPQP